LVNSSKPVKKVKLLRLPSGGNFYLLLLGIVTLFEITGCQSYTGSSKINITIAKPSQSSNKEICGWAVDLNGQWEQAQPLKKWVTEAKKRNLSLTTCLRVTGQDVQITQGNIARSPTSIAREKPTSTNWQTYSDQSICSLAVTHPPKPLAWDTSEENLERVTEALRRGLSLGSCGEYTRLERKNRPVVVISGKSPAPSLSEVTNKNAVAVIVGNRNYSGRIPKVDYAKNDADAFQKFVTDQLGYDPENIIDLRDATKAQLETAFGNHVTHEGKLWRYMHPKGKSDVTVFYSGHGVPGLKDRRSYLLPVDADPESPEINGYSLDTLFANLGKLKARSITVFLDACFSGDSSGGALTRSASGITIKARLPKARKGITIIAAAQSDQLASWDHKAKHGLFTRHLLDALKGAADTGEHGNKDGKINLAETRAYLDDHLTRQARRDYGRVQNAWIKGSNKTVLATTQ
jgi:hypothetical protein